MSKNNKSYFLSHLDRNIPNHNRHNRFDWLHSTFITPEIRHLEKQNEEVSQSKTNKNYPLYNEALLGKELTQQFLSTTEQKTDINYITIDNWLENKFETLREMFRDKYNINFSDVEAFKQDFYTYFYIHSS
jgi:hypothetical protein